MTFSRHEFEPLPPYRDVRDALAKALPSLRPPQEISVVDGCEAHLRVNINNQWSPFRRETVPYMIEPMEMATSREFRALVFAGPSRTGKTMLLNSVWAHHIMNDPARIGIYFASEKTHRSYERNTLSAMIRNSPDIAARRGTGRGSDTVHGKLFQGGTDISLDRASGDSLAERSLRVLLSTEFDSLGPSIDGEGDPLTMMLARIHMAGSRGIAIVESSPRAPITDENELSADPHVAPKVEYGVFAAYPQTTRARLYWPCPCCGTFFVPSYSLLDIPATDDPVEAGEAAKMKCPHCAETFGHDLKLELNSAAAWFHMSTSGKPVAIDHPERVRSDMLGYWLDGTQAQFMPWSMLVTETREAERAFAATGSEEKLRAVANTRYGMAYRPRAREGGDIALEILRRKAENEPLPRGVAPDWTCFITISVDTQVTYFCVSVTAWGADGRSHVIDRFDVTKPVSAQEGAAERTLKPGQYAEDWDALCDLHNRRWPVDGGDWELGAVGCIIDLQGAGKTTANAYKFLRRRRAEGQVRFWHLSRGRGGPELRDRVWKAVPESASAKSKRRAARDIEIVNMATDRLKDEAAARLVTEVAGADHCGIGAWMTKEQLVEFTAERRDEKGRWAKRPGFVRNESLDTYVQAIALFILLGGERLKPDDLPDWARVDATNRLARFIGAAEDRPRVEEEAPAAAPWIETRKEWL